MNAKKRKRLIEASLLFVLLAGIVTGLYFGLFAPKDYRDLIPAESKAVIEVPYSTLSELGLFTHGKDANFNLPLSGIDDGEPVFLIITPNEYVGLIMKTKNLARVGKDISDGAKVGICQTPTRTEGFSWTWVDKGWLIAWNEEATIVLGPGTGGERDAIRQTALQMFKANKSKSFRNSKHNDLLDDIEGEAKVYACADAIPMPLGTMIRLGLPDGVAAKNVVLVGKLESETDGRESHLCFRGKLTGEDEDIAKKLESASNGKTLSEIPATNFSEFDLSMGICANGEKLVGKIKKESDGKMLLSAIGDIVEIKNLLTKADGNILISASRLTSALPDFSLTMQKSDAARTSEGKMKAEEIFSDGASGVVQSKDGYQKVLRNGTIYFTETDSLLYIRTRESNNESLQSKIGGNEKGGIRQFMYLNFEKADADDDTDNPLRLLSKFIPGKKKLLFEEYFNGELIINFY